MIDLHCHLLPGLDDGSSNLEQSLSLAKQAVSNGITHSVFTPHIHPGRYDNNKKKIKRTFTLFRSALNENDIALATAFAAEVRICPEIMPMIEKEEIPFYGQYQGNEVMLLEFPSSHLPPGSDKLIKWLRGKNILPLIAHPERNREIAKDISKLKPLIEMDCLLQITASSIAGLFGSRAEKTAKKLLEKDLVSVIASDSHNKEHRPPIMEHGRIAAAKIIGESEVQKLVYETPLAIARDQFKENGI